MRGLGQNHPAEESLEEYALGRLTGRELEEVEEHLLICAPCQDAVTEIDRFIAVMKDATGKLRKEKSTRAGGKPKGRWFGWLRFQSGPTWMGALAAAALAVAVWIPRSPTVAYEAEVTVRAVRGADEGVAAVPRGKSFLLKADVAGIPAAEGYRLEIVDARGSEIWQASVPRTGTTVATLVPKKLRSGRYWVRIYGSSSALLREYALDSR